MPRINLLPWRDTQRKERQQKFLVGLTFSVAMAAGIVAYAGYYIEDLSTLQNKRNALLDEEITLLKQQIVAVQNLKKDLANLRERMDIVQRLQSSRPEIVHIFDEIPRLLPEGVYITSLNQKGGSINMEGSAQSNARISTLMRSIITSKWLTDPVLGVIQTSQQGSDRISKFTLQVQQISTVNDKNNAKPEKAIPGKGKGKGKDKDKGKNK